MTFFHKICKVTPEICKKCFSTRCYGKASKRENSIWGICDSNFDNIIKIHCFDILNIEVKTRRYATDEEIIGMVAQEDDPERREFFKWLYRNR